jgi:CheY-like chemotaxis protein
MNSAANIMTREKNLMNRTIEADFFPHAFEAIKDKPCILIVDNNRDFTRSAKLALEKTGSYSVFEENDAIKAHQRAQNLKPDLILLDIAMPGTDGGEVAARIQSDPALDRTPIVFLTALVTEAETRSGLRIQGHPSLSKPISFSDLIAGIEANLPVRASA